MVIKDITPTLHAVTVADPVAQLRARVAGQVITADDPAYDAARTTISGRHGTPLAIVRVSRAEDVAAAVDIARDNALPLAVRSGGHSLARYNVVTDAVVVDFTAMKAVQIDRVTRIARVQPGATSADIAGPAGEHGLALTTGDTHSVGIGGLTTGGGVGFMVRKHGLTIDNLLQAQVVLASGEIVTASETEHPDLFWAIRGGGGNAGIVTEFTFQLAEVPQILGGVLALPATREAIRGYLETSIDAPEELTTIANIMRLPPAPFVPEDRVGELALLIFVVYAGDIADGEQALAPLRAVAEPVVDFLNPMPYPAIYEFTAPFAEPHAASIRMMFADDLSDGAIDAMLAAFEQQTSPFGLVQLRGLGGAFGRVPVEATAFAHRERQYFVAVINVWLDWNEDRAPHEAWTAALWEAIRPEGKGVYVNFLEREGEGRVHEAYPNGTYERLQSIKTAYDPDNLFRFNQNIAPKA